MDELMLEVGEYDSCCRLPENALICVLYCRWQLIRHVHQIRHHFTIVSTYTGNVHKVLARERCSHLPRMYLDMDRFAKYR